MKLIETARIFDDALTVEEHELMAGEAQHLVQDPQHYTLEFQGVTWRGMMETDWAPPVLEDRDIVAQGFRAYQQGLEQPSLIHTDEVFGGYTCITLVECPYPTAIAFFRHTELGWSRAPEERPGWWEPAFDEKLHKEGLRPDLWTLTDLIELRARRHVIFESRLFHSRYPTHDLPGTRVVHVAWFR